MDVRDPVRPLGDGSGRWHDGGGQRSRRTDRPRRRRRDHGTRQVRPSDRPGEDIGTEDEWRGWWGPNPPFHTPVFVLTHHPRPSIEMEGGTVFHFLDASPHEALAHAREAAGDLDVRIGGGPTMVRDFLAEDLVDLLHLVQVPIVLGGGVRLWDGLEGLEERFEIEAISAPSGVTHLTLTRNA